MRNALLILTALTVLFAPWSGRAEEIALQYKGLTVTANLETGGAGWQQKPVLLMTHGTLAHNRMEIIQSLQGAFKERGYGSLAINLSLGLSGRTGMYDCAVPHTHRHTDALDEIGLWLQWLKRQGATEVVLLGHSRGGDQTAWFAAERDDPAIRSVVLVAPQVWDEKGAAAEYRRRYSEPLAPVLARAEKLASSDPGTMMKDVDFIYCGHATVSAGSFVSYYRPEPRLDTPTLLPQLHKPVLVFAGSEDHVVEGLADKVAPLADGDKVQLYVIDGADHYFRDLYVEDLADAAAEFIAAH